MVAASRSGAQNDVFQRNDVPNVDLDGETQNTEIAVRTWWEKRDWIRLFYIDFAKLHFTWPPSGGDWPGLVADIILAYEEGDASKIARAHYALAEGYFYEGARVSRLCSQLPQVGCVYLRMSQSR
jgi:hypothetical protein